MSEDDKGEDSDLFSVKSYSVGGSIPIIEKVPLTKEEVARRRNLRILYVILAALAIAGAAWLTLHLMHVAEVREAATGASDDGRVATMRSALELLDGDDDDESSALKLRLRAMLVLAGEDEAVEPIAGSLTDLVGSADEDVARERGIAATYLALAEGELQDAMTEASRVVADGDSKAEAAHARALAAWAVGNVEQALAAARIAVEERPQAPRHVALLAMLVARGGQWQEAISVLDELPAGVRSSVSRLARARILDGSGADITQVAEHAQAVLDDDAATPHERAWAQLLLGRASAARGDRVAARGHLDSASEVAPPGDELFTLALTEAALRIGAHHLAAQVAERLPSPLSVDAGRRAQLSAELALARHDLRAAEGSLRRAPEGPRTDLAQARLLEARGEIDQARTLYGSAAEDPGLRLPATTYLAAMELGQGRAAEAVAQVQPLLAEHPNHPDIVPVAVEAQLGLEQAPAAMALVSPALEQHPEDQRLLAARAHVQMALEQWEEALETLDTALRITSDDEDLHADRGRAARQLSRLEVAREAFDRALELSPGHPAALLGRLELDVEEMRPALGRAVLDRIDEAEMRSLRIEQLRGRLALMEIAGASALSAVRAALRQHSGDRDLRMSLGWLQVQAEKFALAVRTFGVVISAEDHPADALIARSIAQIRMRASNPARATLENLSEELEEDEDALPAAVRADLHAGLARLAWADHDRATADREARRALELDPLNAEAHIVTAETALDRGNDATESYMAAMRGPRPSSRPLASLAIREDEVTDVACEYAQRYRRTAPDGQYARGVARVLRDCRARARAARDE